MIVFTNIVSGRLFFVSASIVDCHTGHSALECNLIVIVVDDILA